MCGHRGKMGETVDARRKVVSHVSKNSARPGCRPDHSDLLRDFAGDRAGILEPLDTGRCVPQQLDRFRELLACSEESRFQVVDLRLVDIKPDAPDANEPSTEPRAAELSRH